MIRPLLCRPGLRFAPPGYGLTWRAVRERRCGSDGATDRVDVLDPREIALVVSDDDAVVRRGDGGDDGIEGAARAALCPGLGHDPGPDQAGFFVERQDASGEQRLRTLRAGEPGIEQVAPLAGRRFRDAPVQLGEGQAGNEQIPRRPDPPSRRSGTARGHVWRDC